MQLYSFGTKQPPFMPICAASSRSTSSGQLSACAPLQSLNMPQVTTEPFKVLPNVIKKTLILATYLNC